MACHVCKLIDSYIYEDNRTGDHVCSTCGHCSGAVVSSANEWRTFADSNAPDPNRVGVELDFTLSSASMEIIASSLSGSSSSSSRREFKRRRPAAVSDATVAQDNRQRKINQQLRTVCQLLNLNKRTLDTSKMASLKCKHVHRLAPVVAASVKDACRTLGIARNMNEICWAAKLPNCKAAWKLLTQMLNVGANNTNATNPNGAVAATATTAQSTTPVTRPYTETPKWETFCATNEREAAMHGRMAANRLNLSYALGTVVENAIKLAKVKGVLDGTRPTSIAAAAAYLVATTSGSNKNLSKKKVATTLGLSEGALRRSAKALEAIVTSVLQPTLLPKQEPEPEDVAVLVQPKEEQQQYLSFDFMMR